MKIVNEPRVYVDQNDERQNGRKDVETVSPVVAALEEDIVLGRLHPRQRLIEDDLMRRFAVKRHVIRQGLAELEQMGIVEKVPNRGALVRTYEPSEIQQLYVVRDLLESHAARLIPMPLGGTDLDELRKVQLRHDKAVEAGELGQVFHSNVEFHEVLFSKAGNRYLSEAIKQFALRTHGIRFYCLTYPGYLHQARQEHWEMIRAIETCDRQSLVKLCSQHLLASRACYERVARGVIDVSRDMEPISRPAAV
jgi:DNA-binding GntR family transcriptional regulator